MTAHRLHECLDDIGWSLVGLAEQLECDVPVVMAWAYGREEIPHDIERWLEALAHAHQTIPWPRWDSPARQRHA